MATPVIAFIGAGNMGSCLIAGLINSGHAAEKIWAADLHPEKLQSLAKLGVHTTTDNHEAVQSADVIIFATKPHSIMDAAAEIANVVSTRSPLMISIAAGVRIAYIKQCLGHEVAIVRAMPNTPALVGSGATALFANSLVTNEQRNLAESILRAVGIVVWVNEENELDIVTALSGSGPAYFFLVMEALQQAAEHLGLSAESARLLTLQTALGAARMALESGKSLESLRHNVTSPGGTTEKAVSFLINQGIHDMFKQALHAAKKRSEELGNEVEKQ